MQKLTFPVGRIVQGSLYARQPVKDDETNQPKLDKATGQPRTRCFFAVAIPKGAETHWNQTPWGQIVWADGMAGDNLADRKRDFSWKVSDGDSTEYDKKNNRPCDKEGFPKSWIVRFSTEQSSPKLYSSLSGKVVEAIEKDEILTGYWVEVRGSVKFNGSSKNPGLYCNPDMVCLRATDARIVSSAGESVAEAGFGAAPLPAGVTPRPTGSVMPPIPGSVVVPPAAVVPPPAAVVVPPPAPAFRMPPPIPAPARVMLPAAQGATYEQCIAGGWTDALLIEHKMMAG